MKAIANEHPELFHYTTAAGLEGILKTQTLWATHAMFLNDPSEIIAFGARLPEFLRPAVGDGIDTLVRIPANEQLLRQVGGKAAMIEEVVRGLTTGMYAALLGTPTSAPFIDPYVLSFCTPPNERVAKHGLLSQWRGYGRDGGYALVFDTARLDSLLNEEAKRWIGDLFGGDVIYSSDPPDKFREELGEAVDAIKTGVAEFLRTAGDPNTLDNTYYSLIQCACRYKHWGFDEEKEVRVIAIPSKREIIEEGQRRNLHVAEKPLRSFIRGGTVVPCIHLFEGITKDPGRTLPITRVIVGPHPDKEKRGHAVDILLRECGLEVPVSVSEIPYAGHR
jgi:Protein of unknown function (DUF2971)